MACLLVIIVPAIGAAASSPYNFGSWTVDSGLPQNTVYAIRQTQDGYLWFTTLDGLVRFDGVRFTVFSRSNTEGLSSNRFNTLLEDGDGDLWAGTEDGGLARYRDGRFTTYTTADGLPNNRILGLLNNAGPGLLVLTQGGPARWRDGQFTALTGELPAGIDWRAPIYEDRSGALWYGDGRRLRCYKDAVLTSYNLPGESFRHPSLYYEDPQANLWIGAARGRLARLKQGKLTAFSVKDGLPDAEVTAILEDRQGNLWVGTRAGLACLEGDRFVVFTTATGLNSNSITALCEDSEGNLWVGNESGGVNRLTRKAITALTRRNGLATDIIYPIFQDRLGDIWIGGMESSLMRYKNGVFTMATRAGGPPLKNVTALAEDRQGRVWIGKIGAIWIMKDGRLTQLHLGVPLGSVIVRAIHEDREGTIWFATSAGLLKYRDQAGTRYTTQEGLAGNDAEALLEDRQGRLWIGTYGGLSLYEQGRFTSFTEADGLASNRIRSLYEDEDGALWIGSYDGGLARFKAGAFTRFTTKEGLSSDGVFCILEDGRGNLWMSSNRGIYRASRRQLNDFADGKVRRIACVAYGKQDGLVNIECNGGRQPAGYKMRDGKLWFPTQGGIAVVDPDAISINWKPPAAVVEECLLQHEPVDAREGVEIKPGKDNLEIRYTGLSFINPEYVHFRYKMEGLDEDWVDAGTRRVAYYAYLPPGHYTFKVIAANRDGVWGTQSAAVRVVVIPPFWQTWWFMAAATATLVAAAALAFHYRLRQVKRAHAAQEAFSRQLIESQESERKRIAAELHDSLGQNLLIIKNRALLGTRDAQTQQAFKEQFDLISATASQALDEVRQIAYNLRPYHLDQLGLTHALEAMIEKVAAAAPLRLTASLAPLDGLFSKEAEINIYRVVQECVNNIIKHAQATAARVEIRRESHAIYITVEDNGRGFVLQGERSGRRGFGLTGMSERVRMLGGTHKVHSAIGQGTTISIKVGLHDESDGQE